MENRNKVIIGILSVLLVIVGIIAVYLGITSDSSKSELQAQIDELKNRIDSDIEEVEEEIKETNESNQTTQNVANANLPNALKGKCLNADENTVYSPILTNFRGVTAEIKNGGESVLFSVSWDSMKELYPNIDQNMNTYTEYTINNFSKEVVNVYIYGMGQAAGEETLLFLMEDGTVEYMPIYRALKEKEFKSYGKIDNVSDIVYISLGEAKYNVDGSGNGPGGVTMYAINSEGNYYNLGTLINRDYYNN